MLMPKEFTVSSDGSLIDSTGKILLYAVDRFRNEIVNGDCCFICGAKREQKVFNDEHVIPDWVLRFCDLNAAKVTLPNDEPFQYTRYKIPCCADCNSDLGEQIETPVSELFKYGYRHFTSEIASDEVRWKLFQWLNLIFLKTHLKDTHLPFHLDRRRGSQRIDSLYEWSWLHHIHCVARSHFTRAVIDKRIIGTLYILPAKSGGMFGEFDFGDVHSTRSILVRIKDIAIIAMLDDACGVYSLHPDFLYTLVKGSLSPLQLREVFARTCYFNDLLLKRPEFYSDIRNGKYTIGVVTPNSAEISTPDDSRCGEFMHAACKSFYDHVALDDIENKVRSGRWTFIHDANGNFIDQEP